MCSCGWYSLLFLFMCMNFGCMGEDMSKDMSKTLTGDVSIDGEEIA